MGRQGFFPGNAKSVCAMTPEDLLMSRTEFRQGEMTFLPRARRGGSDFVDPPSDPDDAFNQHRIWQAPLGGRISTLPPQTTVAA
jgi:hypothetical protein